MSRRRRFRQQRRDTKRESHWRKQRGCPKRQPLLIASSFRECVKTKFVPEGHPKIAHRFIVGKSMGSEVPPGTAEITFQPDISSVPRGLLQTPIPPTDESVGYFQASLRDSSWQLREATDSGSLLIEMLCCNVPDRSNDPPPPSQNRIVAKYTADEHCSSATSQICRSNRSTDIQHSNPCSWSAGSRAGSRAIETASDTK